MHHFRHIIVQLLVGGLAVCLFFIGYGGRAYGQSGHDQGSHDQGGHAQPGLDAYLSAHAYPFTLDSGFDARTRDSLRHRLQGYRLILQAEGGSHDLSIYTRLPLLWIAYLNQQFGLRHFFLEAGHGSDVLERQYLRTEDSAFILVRDKAFWKGLYAYDQSLPEDRRVLPGGGVDFERARTCIPALKLLWKQTRALPDVLRTSDRLLADAPDTTRDCDTLLALLKALNRECTRFEPQFREYLGSAYGDFADMVRNPGSCKDVFRNRNGHMASRLLDFAAREGDPLYYGEFGEAHTVLHTKASLAHLVNEAPGWEGRVCTVNLYCYQCTADESVNNWPLKPLEADILEHCLPLCNGPFTLFDVSGLSRFSAYGAFLIVARGQR